MIGNFFLFNSNSKEPSSTISINPIVPRTGNTVAKLGISIFKKTKSCFMPQPKSKRRITDGILVLEEVKSKKYAIKNIKQMIIIIVVVMLYLSYRLVGN